MKKKAKYFLLLLLLIVTTGCTTYLKGNDGKPIVNKVTGQSLTENILCRPTEEETIKLYKENNYDLSQLPYCVCNSKKVEEKVKVENNEKDKDNKEDVYETKQVDCQEYTITSGKYEGLWTAIFVKPLAWVILFFGKLTSNFGLGLIITSILIRLISYPLTKKSTVQQENMQKIQPEMQKIEKKYANKDQKDREVMMQKSQEMMMLYKKYNVSPMAGCLPALLQIPLFIGFLDAINRVPAIFEEKMLSIHLGTTPQIGITNIGTTNGNWLYIVLTVLVAITTYFAFSKTANNKSLADNNMAKQTKMMTNGVVIMIIVMSIFMSSALNIYWIVSNTCIILQNIIVKRSMK